VRHSLRHSRIVLATAQLPRAKGESGRLIFGAQEKVSVLVERDADVRWPMKAESALTPAAIISEA
jgi:hypothetical protein